MLSIIRLFGHAFFQIAAVASCIVSFAIGFHWVMPIAVLVVFVLASFVTARGVDAVFSKLQPGDIEIALFRFINRSSVITLCGSVIYWLIELKDSIDLGFIGAGLLTLISMALVGGQYLHELGHSKIKIDRIFCKILSIAVGYGHFKREHTYHHEKRVFGPMKSESFYSYMNRNYFGGFERSIEIETNRVERNSRKYLSNSIISNYAWLALVFIVMVGVLGVVVTFSYLVIPVTFLISTQLFFYVSHYGFQESDVNNSSGVAWDSPNLMDRIFLANSGRHSEHHKNHELPHFMLGKRSMSKALLPAGYPMMMLLALIPGVWYMVMNHRLDTVLANPMGGTESQWDKGSI